LDRLRGREAISYAVEYVHLRIGGGRTLEYLVADGAAHTYRQILDGLAGAVEELANSGPTTEELDTLQRLRLQTREHPQYALGCLDSTAERRLLGLWAPSPDEAEEKTDSLTTGQLRDELGALLPSLLAIGPQELGSEVPGWSQYSTWSAERVEGRTYEAIPGREKGSLIVGNEGVSWVLDEDRHRTVRWADAVACFTWDNGMRSVLGPTGAFVQIAPWNWRGGQELTSVVDASVEPSLLVRLGEGQSQYRRDPNDPDSAADIRWLASIVGALKGSHRVDLLVDTQGLYVLYNPSLAPASERLKALRSKDRDALLAADAHNRCLPQGEIERARIAKRPLASINSVKATLTIDTKTDGSLRIHLRTDDQVRVVRGGLEQLLGERFKG
jgi:hypothetical protein